MEGYHDFGSGMAAAKAAFSEIENATKIANIDVSIAGFLSPWKQDGKTVMASYLNGDPIFDIGPNGMVPREIRNIIIDIPVVFEGVVGSVLVDGCGTPDHSSLDNPDYYMMSTNAMAGLGKILTLGYSNKGMQRMIRDHSFASECAHFNEEKNISLVYREKAGIKKAFGVFSGERKWPLFDEILEMAEVMSDESGRDFMVGPFDITQRGRRVSFISDDDDLRLTVSFADSYKKDTKVIWHGNQVSVTDGDLVRAARAAMNAA